MANSSSNHPLSRRAVAAYGAASAPFEMLKAPGLAILPALYAKQYGFSLTAISMIMLVLRLSDAAMDLTVGYLSDRSRSRWGPRKPWLVASIFVFVPAALVLYMPGDNPTLVVFAIGYFFYYLGWAMFDIPYTAWGTELATGYHDRSRLAVSRQLFSTIGLVLVALIPMLPFLASTEMNFEAIGVAACALAFLYPTMIALAVTMAPSGVQVVRKHAESLRESWRAVRGNPPLLLFLAMALLSDLAMGVNGAMAFIFFDTYLGIGASFTLIFVTALLVSLLSLKAWEIVARRTSKRALLLVCLVLGVVHGAAVLLMTPGPLALPVYMGFLTLYYILGTGRDVAMYAMIGDIVDYDTLKTGTNRAGQFTSAWMVFRKLAYALGPVIGLFIAGVAGYDPSAPSNDAVGVLGLKAANGYVPALLLAAAAVFAFRFPLTEARHRIIRRRLEQRAARAARGTDGRQTVGDSS